MERVVNLDDKRNTVTIEVGGNAFKISRIPLRLNRMYGEYLTRICKYLDQIKETEEEALGDLAESFALDKADAIEKMLEYVLTSNGIEYNRDWWEDNADYTDMETFIVEAMKKDQAPEGKKKAES